MTEAKHTPLPWVMPGDIKEPKFAMPTTRDSVVFTTNNPADAALILRVCNAHSDMLEALKEGARCLEDVGRGKGGWAWEEVLASMYAAIAKATGEQ